MADPTASPGRRWCWVWWSFASQIPILVFSAIGGVITDRFDKRRLLLQPQALSMVQASGWRRWRGRALAPAGAWSLAFGAGLINALDVPTRQAIAVQLVDNKADLPNAIALNSFLMNAARFVGQAWPALWWR